MEPLAALGLACGMIQLVSFSAEIARMAKAAYQSGSVDGDLAGHATRLSILCQDVQRSLGNVTPVLSQAEKDLVRIAQECCKSELELEAKIKALSGSAPKGSVSRAIKSSFNAIMRKNQISKLERALSRYQAAVNSGLLLRIWWVAVTNSTTS